MIVVTKDSLDGVIGALTPTGEYGVDTETTGLSESDSLFSLIIASEHEEYYFNFNVADDIPNSAGLDRTSVLHKLRPIFANPLNTWFIQNAKFDMRMLAKEGVEIAGTVYCTEAMERLVQNNYPKYSLKANAARRGLKKDDSVEVYISKHKLYTVRTIPGKKKKIKQPHFDRVPFPIITKYGGIDARLHREIGIDQQRTLRDLSRDERYPSLLPLVANEARLTKTCFRMERRGIKIDRKFVQTALHYELQKVCDAQREFEVATGRPYKDSNKLFKEVFDACGEAYPTTEKGNASFAADVLEGMSSPAAALINKIRHHEKRAGTYYSSFLHYADEKDVIHPDMRQAGTETGRFSYREPNLQNVPKEDDPNDTTPYPVRASFIPREGHFFCSIDYSQQEFRLMLDYAGEHALIKSVNEEGADVHEQTARFLNISRTAAKRINFGLLYSMGKGKLAASLGVTEREATGIIAEYFAKLPRVKPFLSAVSRSGEARGFIFNWYGRRDHISDKNFSYYLPNHLIQGSAADVIKVAMNRIDDMLISEKLNTKMLLQIHDEVLLEVPVGEEYVIQKIVNIMENVYVPRNGIKLPCSVEYSFKSWAARDKIKGYPSV
jgi:DNA polymerase-1